MTTHEEFWNIGNDAARGYSVGEDSDDINDLKDELGELVQIGNGGDIAVYRSGRGVLVGVGDAHGPWAVDLTAEAALETELGPIGECYECGEYVRCGCA